MGDSESFSSLMDLVNSHLSKTSLNTSQSGDESGSSFPLASVRIQTGLSQTVFTPPNGIMAIPRLGQDNEITGILAQQVTNMLIAKERKKQEDEKKRLEDEINLQKQQNQAADYDIDLMSSIVTPNLEQELIHSVPEKSASVSSMESLLGEIKCPIQEETNRVLKKIVNLPLNQDMSYMLSRKVKKGNPSAFGKVMCSRIRPVAAPYMKIDVNNTAVRRFDFSTLSPCDINLEKRRQPLQDPYAHMNMVERFMAQTNNEAMHHM